MFCVVIADSELPKSFKLFSSPEVNVNTLCLYIAGFVHWHNVIHELKKLILRVLSKNIAWPNPVIYNRLFWHNFWNCWGRKLGLAFLDNFINLHLLSPLAAYVIKSSIIIKPLELNQHR